MAEARLGKKHSEETKKKMSEAAKGSNNSFYGHKHSAETLKKLSKAVLCIETGKEYNSIKKHSQNFRYSIYQMYVTAKEKRLAASIGDLFKGVQKDG